MSTLPNYYEILGLSESASDSDIKQAYHRLAKKYHPDLNSGDKQNEEKFKKISEAYNVLRDSKTRREYDFRRRSGFNGGGDFSGQGGNPFGSGFGANIQDFFSSMFEGQNDPFGGGRGGDFDDVFTRTRRSAPKKGANMESTITIPLEMAVNGGETVIKTGTGKRIKIKIPQGVEADKKIRLRGQGAPAVNGGEPGDLYLTIKVAPNDKFERRGNNIYANIFVNIAEAVLGTEVQVETVTGKKVKLKIPPGTGSGKSFRLPGMGVTAEGKTGDHVVRVEIDTPTNLTMKQRSDFRSWAKKVGLI